MSFHPNDVGRRARAATVLLLLTFVFLLSAFFRTQVLRNDQYKLQSESNRLREVPLPAPRGTIFDRNGQVIAENLPGYTVSLFGPSADSLRASLRSCLNSLRASLRSCLNSTRASLRSCLWSYLVSL